MQIPQGIQIGKGPLCPQAVIERPYESILFRSVPNLPIWVHSVSHPRGGGRGREGGSHQTILSSSPVSLVWPDSGDGLQTSMDQTVSHNQTDQFFRPLLNFSPLFRILKRNLFLSPHFVVAHILRVSFVWGMRIEVCPQANFTSFALLSLETFLDKTLKRLIRKTDYKARLYF